MAEYVYENKTAGDKLRSLDDKATEELSESLQNLHLNTTICPPIPHNPTFSAESPIINPVEPCDVDTRDDNRNTTEVKTKDSIKTLEKITIKNRFSFQLEINSILQKNGYSSTVTFMNETFKSNQKYSKRKDAEQNAFQQAINFYNNFSESLNKVGSNVKVPGEVSNISETGKDADPIKIDNTKTVIGGTLGHKSAKTLLTEHAVQHAKEPPLFLTKQNNDGMFVSTITYDGKSLNSAKGYSKKKEAETDAAEQFVTFYQSLNSEIDINESSEDESKQSTTLPPESLKIYKNVLQEFCQQNSKAVPRYISKNHGLGFISTVVLNGQEYKGEPARTKIDAEMSAATVAIKNSTEIHSFLSLKKDINVNEWLQDLKDGK